MKVTRAGRQPCDPKYSRLAERIEALQAEIAALASELSVVSGSAGQAVVTAEDAQASAAVSAAEAGTARTAAEAAAATAQGVSDRVTAAEAAIDDVQDYAEAIGDDVAALDTEIHTSRPYVDTNSEQTITAKKHIPTATAGDSSDVWVNKAFVQSTDGRNNLIHSIGFEQIFGIKKHWDTLEMAIPFDITARPEAGSYHDSVPIVYADQNGLIGGFIRTVQDSNGILYLQCALRNSDGTYKYIDLARSD